MTAPIPGDPVYLGSFLANTHWYGVVGDGDTPAMQVATMEAVGQDAVVCLDALKGDQGEKGDPAEIVYERMFLYEELHWMVGMLFRKFGAARASADWSPFADRMREWAGGNGAQAR